MGTEERRRDTNIIYDDYKDIMYVLRNRANEMSAKENDVLAHVAGMYAANEPVSNEELSAAIRIVNRIIYPHGAGA